jgi:hypothetical protein
VLLQEQEQRETEASLGKTARAAMTCRATIRKQPGGRFALVEILSVCGTAGQHTNCAKRKQTTPQLLQRHEFRRYLHAAVVLRRDRTAVVMLNIRPPLLTRSPARVMVEERQKGGGALDGQQAVATSNGRLISLHCQSAALNPEPFAPRSI